MSDTPRVDSIAEHHYTAGGLRSASVVQACFARELERELSKATAERDEARREACALRVLCTTTSQNCEQIAAERGWDCFKEGTEQC
jgi:hypothetical protein